MASSTPSLQLINEYLAENVVFITEEAPPGQVATELHFFLYKNNFIRTSRLKTLGNQEQIKNNISLRFVKHKNIELNCLFSMSI